MKSEERMERKRRRQRGTEREERSERGSERGGVCVWGGEIEREVRLGNQEG